MEESLRALCEIQTNKKLVCVGENAYQQLYEAV